MEMRFNLQSTEKSTSIINQGLLNSIKCNALTESTNVHTFRSMFSIGELRVLRRCFRCCRLVSFQAIVFDNNFSNHFDNSDDGDRAFVCLYIIALINHSAFVHTNGVGEQNENIWNLFMD